MILRVTDGTTMVNLAGGTDDIYLAENYAPVAPDFSVVEAVSAATRDGGEVTAITRRNVTESVVVSIVGASFSAVQSAKNDLELLFAQAAHRQSTQKGARVYVEYRAADSGSVYRSELLHARMEPDRETASEGWIDDSAMRFVIAWQRRFYWEGPEAELALDNGSTGSKQTGGVTIYNHDDAGSGHDNWVDIDGDDVAGDIPAPLRIQMQNTYNDTSRSYRVRIASNVFANPSSLAHILEGEDADSVAGSAAATANSDSSGGYYQTASWSGSSEAKAYSWDLAAAYLANCKGYRFRILGRVHSATSGLRMRIKVLFAGLTVVAESPEVDISSSGVQDFGVIQLPPWLPGETDLYEISLALYGRRADGGTVTVSLDFIQVTALDGYRAHNPVGYGFAYTTTFIDDGIERKIYVNWGGSGKVGFYPQRDGYIHAWPGQDQRLYFLVSNSVSLVDIVRTHSVRVYYRPRRLTI